MSKQTKVSILEALADADAADLEAIEKEILALEKKLAQLKAAKSLVDIAVNGPKAKVPVQRKRKADGASGPTWADKIVEHLKEHGPSSVRQIVEALGCTPAVVYASAPKDRCQLRDGLMQLK